MGARFREMLRGSDPLQCIGVFDVPSARMVEIEGFKSVFIGGSSAALAMGYPDWGLTSITNLIEFSSRIAANISIPALADADDGGGNPLSVYRAVQAFEKAGLAGAMFEDRLRVERIGQPAEVIPKEEMVNRIRAAADARGDLVIVVRCDAIAAKRSMQEGIDRANAYAEAGADVLFFIGPPIDDFPKIASAVSKPLGANVDSVPLAKLRETRIKLATYTLVLQNVAQAAVHKSILELKTTGSWTESSKLTLPRDVNAKLTRSAEITDQAKKYGITP
jgi:methylisocitrate lyase